MDDPKYLDFYRRHLPHFQPPEARYLVTLRLAGTLPLTILANMKQEYLRAVMGIEQTGSLQERLRCYHEAQMAYFKKFDSLLDFSSTGPIWLADARVANIVSDALHFFDGRRYDLLCFSIMPNHIHSILDTNGYEPARLQRHKTLLPLTQILSSVKSYTAHEANKVLHRSGAFWQQETYDHVVRDSDELEALVGYVLSNPVKAHLVSYWQEWPWTYCKDGYL
jgi:putative transposase